MRRIYESDALKRDDDEFMTPRERRRRFKPQSFRYIDSTAWTDRLLPHALRKRAVTFSLSTPRQEFEQGVKIPFAVSLRNRLPMPLTIRTNSPLLWTWEVNGHQFGSYLDAVNPPDEPSRLHLDRGERKQIRQTWSGLFRISKREWEPAEPGEYTISAALNIENPKAANLADKITIEILD